MYVLCWSLISGGRGSTKHSWTYDVSMELGLMMHFVFSGRRSVYPEKSATPLPCSPCAWWLLSTVEDIVKRGPIQHSLRIGVAAGSAWGLSSLRSQKNDAVFGRCCWFVSATKCCVGLGACLVVRALLETALPLLMILTQALCE